MRKTGRGNVVTKVEKLRKEVATRLWEALREMMGPSEKPR